MPNVEKCCRCPGCGVCKANDLLEKLIDCLSKEVLPGSGVSLRHRVFDLMNEGREHLKGLR